MFCESRDCHKKAFPFPDTNYIVRLVQKRRLCGDLVWAVTQLPLNKKEAIDAVNNVLRTLDELTRNINSQVSDSSS